MTSFATPANRGLALMKQKTLCCILSLGLVAAVHSACSPELITDTGGGGSSEKAGAGPTRGAAGSCSAGLNGDPINAGGVAGSVGVNAESGAGGAAATAGRRRDACSAETGAGANSSCAGMNSGAGMDNNAGDAGAAGTSSGGQPSSAGGMNNAGGEAGEGGVFIRPDCGAAPQRGVPCLETFDSLQISNVCMYDTAVCVCGVWTGPTYNPETTWACFPRDCPEAMPFGGCTSATNAPRTCDYGPTKCTCDATVGSVSSWECDKQIDCPAVAPVENQPCTPIDVTLKHNTCEYENAECRCGDWGGGGGKRWTCLDKH